MLKSTGMKILSEVGWLSTTPEHFRAAMLPNCDLITIRRGQTFFNVGDETGGIFGVAEGRLEIHVPSGVGGATLAHLCGIGHWFGETAAIGGGKRRVSIIAATHTQLLRLSRANMQRLTEQDPEAWMHFAQLMAVNLSIAMDVVTAIRFEEPLQRVAATLRNLVGADRSSVPKIAVSQSDLGAMTGLSRNTVNIVLAELERLAVVNRRYSVVEITDLAGLRGVLTG
jgi:CRP-like cAMP-binding protein